MSATERSHSEARGASSTSTLITTPSGATSGDVLYCFVYTTDGTQNSVPSGFSLLEAVTTQGNTKLGMYENKLTGSPSANYTWGFSAANNNWLVMIAVQNADSTTPADAFDTKTGNSTTITAPTVTPTWTDDLLLCWYGITGSRAITLDGSVTLVDDGVTGPSYSLARKALSSADPTGNISATVATNNPWIGAQLAIRSSGGGPPATTLKDIIMSGIIPFTRA